jgi:hypothetical protein
MLNLEVPAIEVFVLSGVSALVGGIILSRFTTYFGIATYLVNILVLFAGGVLANMLVEPFYSPLDNSLQRPLFIALIGMLIVAILTLAIFSRGRYGR